MKRWELLLAHNHWITIGYRGKDLKLCARCTGVVLGFTSLLILSMSFDLGPFLSLPLIYQIILCILLALPAILDWITQSWQIRESNNPLRLVTGFFKGLGISLLSMISIPLSYKILLIISIAGLTVNLGLKQNRL
ncbi:MAG: DUF2085 domain-containing protein [Nitrososphaerota archaeon]|nr:DUF2085 domain-containing protein [Nitrososphaerales archaeon]MDW8045396.1 DUF2085 domain-containing protein [Nitrososphaerota archaeon]